MEDDKRDQMSFRPNYSKKSEGEEKKTRPFLFRKHGFRKSDITEEEKAAMGMVDVPDMENVDGIIRYSVADMLKLRSANTKMPDMPHEDCVIGYERLSEMLKEQADLVAEKEQVIPPATEFPTEVPVTVRVDSRVRALRNIMNQFTLDNPELITDMLYNNIEGYIEEPEVLRCAIESIINRCCTEALYCDAFVAVLRVVIEKMSEKQRHLFLSCLLTCCQAKYEEKEPEEEWSKMEGEIAAEARTIYENARCGFFHFLGDLFVNELIHEEIILTVLVDLSHGYPKQHDKVRYVLTLVRTIGSYMEREAANKLTIDEIFRTLHLWQEEGILPEEMIAEVRNLRDLKDAKWVITVEVDKNMESTVAVDWEKSVAGRRKNNKKEIAEEEAEQIRQQNELVLYCKNLWLDFVRNFVVEDIMEEVEKFDEEQQETFLHCSIKALSSCSDLEQRRAAVLLRQLLEREVISKEVLTRVLERILADYAKMRKSNKNMVVVFRNLYFLLVLDGTLSITTIIELWKSKDHYDGLLAELVFDLLNSWKNINKDVAIKTLEDLKLTVEQVFVGGCPALVAERILTKHGMIVKDGFIHFAYCVYYQTSYFLFR